MAVEIRDARPEDAGRIARLLGQLGYPADDVAVTRRLARLGDDLLLVAEANGEVAGLAHVQISPSPEYDRPAAKLAALSSTIRIAAAGSVVRSSMPLNSRRSRETASSCS